MSEETLSEESLAVEEQAEVEVEETTDALEAEDAGDDVEESTESESEDKPKKKGGFQRRIERLEREKFEAEMRAEEAARQAREYQQYVEQQQRPSQGLPIPKLSDFDYDEERYSQAVQQWNQGQLQAYAQQQAELQQQQRMAFEQQQQAMALQQKVAAATAKYPDFVTAVNNPDLPPLQRINPVAFQAIVNSPAFDDIAYRLAKNPSEIYAFRNLSPDETFRKITRMEIEFEGGKQPVTKAPPPPPAKLSGKSKSSKEIKDMTMEEYVEFRRKQKAS